MIQERMAIFGGVYSNHIALAALLADVRQRGIGQLYCLGDLGAFGPHPDRVFPLLRAAQVAVVQGNYDHSLGHGLPDCRCGYTDARDNHFARLSYAYTFHNTSAENKRWLKDLPPERRLTFAGRPVLLCHGSPRQTNEFLWESTTSNAFLARMFRDADADVIVATHTGLPWHRELPGDRHFINCGALGRPANDGRTAVWYAVLSAVAGGGLDVEFVPLEYDYRQLAAEMRAEQLPEEFVTTIETGWWTTCLEILPARERARGKY